MGLPDQQVLKEHQGLRVQLALPEALERAAPRVQLGQQGLPAPLARHLQLLDQQAQLGLVPLDPPALAARLVRLVAAEAVMEQAETSFLPIILEASNGCYINTNFYTDA
jgi:hypothetical protein